MPRFLPAYSGGIFAGADAAVRILHQCEYSHLYEGVFLSVRPEYFKTEQAESLNPLGAFDSRSSLVSFKGHVMSFSRTFGVSGAETKCQTGDGRCRRSAIFAGITAFGASHIRLMMPFARTVRMAGTGSECQRGDGRRAGAAVFAVIFSVLNGQRKLYLFPADLCLTGFTSCTCRYCLCKSGCRGAQRRDAEKDGKVFFHNTCSFQVLFVFLIIFYCIFSILR